MYVEELVLKDFRAIASSEVLFVHSGSAHTNGLRSPNMNLVVGENGSGKSTVLKAVAAVLDNQNQRTPDGMSGWPRIGGTSDAVARVRLSATGEAETFDKQISLRIGRDQPAGFRRTIYENNFEPELDGFVAAYGSFRQPRDLERLDDHLAASPHHLLFEGAELVSLDRWLPDAAHRAEVLNLLDVLLPEDIKCLKRPDREGRFVAQRGITMPISALSDGVRSFLAWLGDLLARLDRLADGRIVDVEGLVIVDEIDQRMHPRWQQMILPRLASTFPALQFICTAHSPLLLSGLQRENITLVEPDLDFPGEGATKARRLSTEDVYGLTSDQVLRSSYFGLPSTRSDPFWEELRAIAGDAQTRQGGREAALAFMRRLANPNRNNDQ